MGRLRKEERRCIREDRVLEWLRFVERQCIIVENVQNYYSAEPICLQ